MKKSKTLLATLSLLLCNLASSGSANAADYPEKAIQGIIQWGAGGSTDLVGRSVSLSAEKHLGTDIIMINKTGGTGAIATKYVYSKPADGYTLLIGAENPLLYKVMGLGTLDYQDFEPISILARGIPVLVAHKDAPYNSLAELLAYNQANPQTIKAGSTGAGGLASVVMSMFKAELGFEAIAVPYDGDGPALTALQGGAIDIMPAVLGVSIEHIKAGRLKVIALIDSEKNALLPDIEPITQKYPSFSRYLPWGPFFGVFVKKGTPADVVKKLRAAYGQAAEEETFKNLMTSKGYLFMNITSDAANQFLQKWQSVTSWLIWDVGLAKKSPEEFAIPRPQ